MMSMSLKTNKRGKAKKIPAAASYTESHELDNGKMEEFQMVAAA